MAATGFTPLSLYYSSTTTNTPSASNLVNGELAINITDGKLFYKDNNGVVQVLATKAGATGTVSSVALTVPSFLSVTGSPITTSGTLAISLSGTALPIANGGTGQTTASAAFNALSPITSTGDLIIGNGTNSATRLGIGSNNYVLTSNGATASWQPAAASGVSSFSAGTTGLTPSTGTTGTVTLAGTLNVANGGTGSTSLTANNVLLGNGTSALQVVAPGSSGNILTSNGSTWVSSAPSGGSGRLLNVQYFTSSGTYTPTSGTTFVIVEVVGGGGGGGNATSTNGNRGNGGGGGGYARKKITSAFSGVTITIGAGGAAVSAGGTTSFGALVSATGGAAGTTNSSLSDASGGLGSSGDLNLYGQASLYTGQSFNKGGGSFYAPFTNISNGNYPANGLAGSLYGGGGSGAYTNSVTTYTGGAGAAGICIVYEYA